MCYLTYLVVQSALSGTTDLVCGCRDEMLCCVEGWDFLVEIVMVVEGLELQAVRGVKGSSTAPHGACSQRGNDS